MGLADDLKTLEELHEKGQLTDQEYADAKSATLDNQAPTSTSQKLGRFIGVGIFPFLIVLLIVLGIVWYNVGTKNTTRMIATAVHAPVTLKDEVENLAAASVESFGMDVPYSGTVVVTIEVVRGNPIDVFLTDTDQMAAIQKNDWNNVRTFTDFDALKTKTYRRTGQLTQGRYYLVVRDTSLGILSFSTSDISVKVQLNP